jgi:hypothetical protein
MVSTLFLSRRDQRRSICNDALERRDRSEPGDKLGLGLGKGDAPARPYRRSKSSTPSCRMDFISTQKFDLTLNVGVELLEESHSTINLDFNAIEGKWSVASIMMFGW